MVKLKKTTKKIISVLLTAVMAVAMMPVVATAASISIGDYVQMGTYYGKPILWRCVDIDENGPLMLSDKILCLKAFDAETSSNSTTGSHSRVRGSWESNYWADSNIRSWLNSSASAGNVNWLCGNPPIESEVYYNAYDQEAGFLNAFSSGELAAIKEVTQKSLLSYPEIDAGMTTTGTAQHTYHYNINDVVQNYDSAYAEYITDKIFLLDVKQINEVYNNSNILGDDYYIGEPTAECVANSEYTLSSLTVGKKWHTWLRSPDSSGGNYVRYVYSDGVVYDYGAYYGLQGVRPAFYLNLPSFTIKSGAGTESNPYIGYGTGGGTATPAPTPETVVESNTEYSGGGSLINQAGIDANNLLSNISVGTDKIKGPKLSVLGHDFYLFELDGKCSLSLGNVKIQLKADEEKNSIQILGGYDFLSESTSTGSSYTERGEWTKAYNDLKSLHNALAGGTLNDKTARSRFSSVYNKLKKADSNLFLNIKGNFALYGEITFNNGEWKLTEGGGILKASASGSIDPRIGGIFYGTFGVTVDVSGKFAIKYDWDEKELAVNVGLTIEPAINVGVGAGSKKAKFYIEGGLKGKLPIEIAALTGSFKTGATNITPLKVTAKGYIYMSGKAAIFGIDKEWQLGDDFVLYPRDGEVTLQSLESDFTVDKSEFKMLPRDYGSEVSIMSLDEVFEKNDLYPYSTPELVQLSDGRMLLIWIDDDVSKADADRTSMYYSVYDSADNLWSVPQIAVENVGYNDLPQVYADDNGVYVVWTYIDEALGDTAEMDDMLSKLDLYYTYFDGESFSEPQAVAHENNGLSETLYSVCVIDDEPVFVWAENSGNDPALSEGTNTIYKRDGNGVQTVAQINGELHDVQLTADGAVVYEVSENGTTEIYLDSEKIGESENDNTCFNVIGNNIYYLSGDMLNTYDIGTGETDSGYIGEITDITLLKNGDGIIALSLLSNGFTSELYQNEYKNGEWQDWTQLTEYGKYIRDYSAVVNNGSISLALNLVEVEDEEKGGYGSADLKVLQDAEYCDIILDDAPYYDGEITENANICFNVTNNSRNTVNKLNVKITDASGGIMYSDYVECNIEPGQTELLTVTVTIPDGFVKQELTVAVESGFDENNTDNNSASLTIGFADIALEQLALKKSGDIVTLEGAVHNIGFEEAENVVLNIYDSNTGGEHWQTLTFDTLGIDEEKTFSFELPEQYLNTTGLKQSIYIEAVTDSDELAIGNNSDRVVFSELSELETINEVSMAYADGILTIKSPSALGVDFVAAYYNEDGSLITCRKLELAIGAGTNNIEVTGLTTGSNVKFMLWDKDMKPLCETLTWN